MTQLDFSLPLSTLLRESTHDAHEAAENSPAAVAMVNGKLPKDEYIRYLMMLWHIYSAFEQALDRHVAHPVIEATYNKSLARASRLSADISYLLQVPESSWQSHAAHVDLVSTPPLALTAYTSHILEISNSADPSPLVAHAYVRYLGDLSGGQTIRRTLGKAYGLDSDSGLSFYIFTELGSSKPASLGEMKRIKGWFRNGLDSATADDAILKGKIVREANLTFQLNRDLFSAIEVPEQNSEDGQLQKEIPIVIEQKPSSGESGYSVSSVIAVVAAVCIAHYILVINGFTGERGYQKLLAVEDWFATIWSRSE